jgi:protein arginine kinase activator
MLCQSCSKNKATIHFTKIVNGDIEEKHLCDSCAKGNSDFDFEFPFPFHKLFTGLLEISDQDEVEQPNFKKINCPRCGLDYKRFIDTGKFGCAKCYEVFTDEIEILLKNIHGHSNHSGKLPIKSEEKILQKREIENLKKQLKENIRVENFEKAAIIRDEIETSER